MDSVIGLDFKMKCRSSSPDHRGHRYQAVAAYAINEAANQQGAIYGLISQIGTAVYEAA